MTTHDEKLVGAFFRLNVFLKGAYSAFECAGGLLLLLVPLERITAFGSFLTQGELLEDPHDTVASFVAQLFAHLSVHSTTFGGLYLLSHGVIKLFLVVGLLRNKLWSYPWSLAVLGLFIVYQVYRYALYPSLWLILLTVFDLIVLWSIWSEYRIVRKHIHADATMTP